MRSNRHPLPASCLSLTAGALTWVVRIVSTRRCQRVVLNLVFLTAFTISCGDRHQSQNAGPRRKGLQTVTINNVEPRRDVTGNIIDAHDGCLQLFEGRFYLYGTAYGTNDSYTSTANRYRVYSSPDLEQWTLEGELLKGQPDGVYFRPYVVFNPNTRKYVLWYNWYPNSKEWFGREGAAISDTPVGPFKIANPNVQLSHPNTGDGSLFVDDDGTGYFIYTSIGEGYTIRVERLKPDYLGSTGEASSILSIGGEAPVLFRRNGLYYALCGPRCASCPEGSEVHIFISTSPLGPYGTAPTINRRPESDAPTVWTQQTWTVDVPGGKFTLPLTDKITYQNNAPVIPAQQTWVAKIPMSGGPVFVWMADRWQSTPDGIRGHDFQFWSAPLKFNPYDDTILPVEKVARWDITWSWGD